MFANQMLIDEYLPKYEVSARHQITIPAAPAQVYAALWTADLGQSPVIKTLLALRAIPAFLTQPRDALRRLGRAGPGRDLTLETFLQNGFHLLAEDRNRELLIGLVGRFWTPSGNLEPTDAVRFRQALRPGTAQAAWNFAMQEAGGGQTLLTTETRVHCADAPTLRSFRRYWLVVRPFSGVMRQLMLRSVARACRVWA